MLLAFKFCPFRAGRGTSFHVSIFDPFSPLSFWIGRVWEFMGKEVPLARSVLLFEPSMGQHSCTGGLGSWIPDAEHSTAVLGEAFWASFPL